MGAPQFPTSLLAEATHQWNIVGNTVSAGQTSVFASVDVRSDGGGFWSASLNDILLYERRHVLLWRAVRQVANGGVSPLVVPRFDRMQPYSGDIDQAVLPHDDSTFFSDGSGYVQSSIDVIAHGAAALRDTSMTFKLINCAELMGGELFSIEHRTFGWRLYEIGTVRTLDDGLVAVTFNPPLREAVEDGTAIEFDRPRCLMKLVNPAAMDLDLSRLPCSVSVKFVESAKINV